MVKRLALDFVAISVCIYLALVFSALFFSDRVLFQPHAAAYADDANILKLRSADGANISARYLPSPNAPFTVLFSHGNAEDIGDDIPFLEDLRNAGFSVLAYDYQGYGTSEGRASESHVYEDAEAAYDFLLNVKHVPENKIIAFGRSLGSGAAVDLASKHHFAGLVIESGFISAFRVLTKYPVLPFDKFPNMAKLKKVHCPVLIMHGTNDSVVNFYHGQKLYAAANEPKSYLWVNGAGHNDLEMIAPQRYVQALHRFTALIQSGTLVPPR